MLLYSGSKLEQDLKDLTNEVKKTDYEKAIEPFQERIRELEIQLYNQRKDMEALFLASRELINSIEKEHINLIVCTSEPKAYYGKHPEFEALDYQKIKVPIKQYVAEEFTRQINAYANKRKELGWLDE